MAGLSSRWSAGSEAGESSRRLPVVYFSKFMQWLDWEHMAETVKGLGFDGLDVTVREGGTVEPERVREDLPKVAKILRQAGLDIPMITAGIVDADSAHAEEIMGAMNELGIKRYRWGWFSWFEGKGATNPADFYSTIEKPSPALLDIPGRLAQLKKRVSALAALNEKYQVCAMYHNHSGAMVGASVWDLWELLKDTDPRYVSSNFDIGHATVEGGLGGWVASMHLMVPYMRGAAIKDFKWGKDAKGRWVPLWCPLGEGMVEVSAYLATLKAAKFSGPVQLHTEYPLGGAENGAQNPTMDKTRILDFIRKDLSTLRGLMRQAQLV